MKIKYIQNTVGIYYPIPNGDRDLEIGDIVNVNKMADCPFYAKILLEKSNPYWNIKIDRQNILKVGELIVRMPIFTYGNNFVAFTPDFRIVDEN